MSEPVTLPAFVAARLDEEQARAEAMEHFTVWDDTYYSCAATRTEPHGDLPWGEDSCDCGLAGRKAKRLREITAMQAILAQCADAAGMDPWDVGDLGVRLGEATLRRLAAIWSDHADYHPGWAPE